MSELSTLSDPLAAQLRAIIADEMQRRTIVHLHIQVPAEAASDPVRLAEAIARVLTDFQQPAAPVSPG